MAASKNIVLTFSRLQSCYYTVFLRGIRFLSSRASFTTLYYYVFLVDGVKIRLEPKTIDFLTIDNTSLQHRMIPSIATEYKFQNYHNMRIGEFCLDFG